MQLADQDVIASSLLPRVYLFLAKDRLTRQDIDAGATFNKLLS